MAATWKAPWTGVLMMISTPSTHAIVVQHNASKASWVKVAATDGDQYPGPFGHGASCVWGSCTLGSESSGLYMTTFRDQGVPSSVKICLDDGTCTDEFQVVSGATWETPASNTANSLSLALQSEHGVPSPWYLIMARGGLGLCMSQRLDRASTMFTCDGDAGQGGNQVGLMDNWASEAGPTGGGGRWKTTYADSGTPVPGNTYASLYFSYAQAPTPAPTPQAPMAGGASAIGDPHLTNVHGERFDLMQAGKHLLIQIPRKHGETTLLRVDAVAERVGGQCADLYFQELNITGRWADAKHSGGFHYLAQGHDDKHAMRAQWVHLGPVQLKVVHGRTNKGVEYLNFYVKNLDHTGYAIGGLLGEDDHADAEKTPGACHHLMPL